MAATAVIAVSVGTGGGHTDVSSDGRHTGIGPVRSPGGASRGGRSRAGSRDAGPGGRLTGRGRINVTGRRNMGLPSTVYVV